MKKLILLFAACTAFGSKAQLTVSEKDMSFAREAAMGSLLEVKLGELAQANGSAAEVKALGRHMVEDHSKANTELAAIAARKNINLPTTLNAEEQKLYDELAAKKGAEFDKAYTKCMVKDHKKDIAAFEKEKNKGDDAELKAWAASTLPTLEHHKEMAKDACKAVKKQN